MAQAIRMIVAVYTVKASTMRPGSLSGLTVTQICGVRPRPHPRDRHLKVAAVMKAIHQSR